VTDRPYASRRTFITVSINGAVLLATRMHAQSAGAIQSAQSAPSAIPSTAPEIPGTTMAGDGHRPVSLPPKPGARAQLTADERDAVERRLACPCPCTLDVFTCRTSMPCGFSPAMHSDIVKLVSGGYSGDEILAAFENVYGEVVLLSPKKTGFNWLGYLLPSIGIVSGGAVLALLIGRWRQPPATAPVAVPRAGGSPDEMARLESMIRDDERR